MKLSRLRAYTILAMFVIWVIITPSPELGYDGLPIPQSIGDIFEFIFVVATLTSFEVGFLSELFPNMIPLYLKKVMGMFMLFGLGNILQQYLRASTGSFLSDTIIVQAPITMVDISTLVAVGASLYWAGGLMYDTMVQLTIAAGDICYRILKRLNLFKTEDDEGGGEVVE